MNVINAGLPVKTLTTATGQALLLTSDDRGFIEFPQGRGQAY